jgi:hypothetical protein
LRYLFPSVADAWTPDFSTAIARSRPCAEAASPKRTPLKQASRGNILYEGFVVSYLWTHPFKFDVPY